MFKDGPSLLYTVGTQVNRYGRIYRVCAVVTYTKILAKCRLVYESVGTMASSERAIAAAGAAGPHPHAFLWLQPCREHGDQPVVPPMWA